MKQRTNRLLAAAVLAMGLGLTAGCYQVDLKDDYIWNPGYWWRHAVQIATDAHAFRIDIDRTVFGLEDVPVEDY